MVTADALVITFPISSFFWNIRLIQFVLNVNECGFLGTSFCSVIVLSGRKPQSFRLFSSTKQTQNNNFFIVLAFHREEQEFIR